MEQPQQQPKEPLPLPLPQKPNEAIFINQMQLAAGQRWELLGGGGGGGLLVRGFVGDSCDLWTLRRRSPPTS
ncbi:GL26913 [Drosophila persimilis]|uniref:GL26913 n=1 Tax=Drosophila persimilis TaxID=7234 RepID=B4H2V5_DROPE|nr:GL26913 [Drosophila persimilis]